MASDRMNSELMAADLRSRLRLLGLAYLVLFAALVAVGVAVALSVDPHFGEPAFRLQVSLSRSSERHAGAVSPGERSSAAPNSAALYAGPAVVADPALIERTDMGPLPRIATNGTMPMQAYAAPSGDSTKPRVAIIISGLGISAK